MIKRLAILATLLSIGWATPARAQVQPFNYWVPIGACQTSVSGNSTGTNGLTTVGASNTPVIQAHTSVTGTNTHTYICNIAPPVNLASFNGGNRLMIYDAVFVYGQQSEISVAQAAVLASGTFNGSIVFSFINYPPAGASETASTVTPVRADTGTMSMTPAVASFNQTTTTAGAFFTQTFTPSTPIPWNTDLQQLLLTVTLKLYGSYDTITNSPGILIHVRTN